MTARPWWTPSGAVLRMIAFVMKRTGAEASVFVVFGALCYGLTDVFGLPMAVRILWSMRKKKE